MYILSLLIIAAVANGGIVKRSDDCPAKSAFEDQPEKRDQILDVHNGFRANENAANEVKMSWNKDLARRAQQWANNCTWKHSFLTTCDGQKSVGQNLYMIGGGSSPPTNYDISKFIEKWYNEKKDYSYNDGSCSGVCGHYTQVVWAKTAEVGCGIQSCDLVNVNGNPEGSRNAVLFGCDYSPPGNYQGQKPFVQGPTCSECSSMTKTGWVCEDNLCKPCVRAADANCQCNEKTCQNGGVFDDQQCVCSCPESYYGEFCENSCVCQDLPNMARACPGWTVYCNNKSYKQFMKTNCPATCGMCDLPPSCNA